jgi:hypothetical protein
MAPTGRACGARTQTRAGAFGCGVIEGPFDVVDCALAAGRQGRHKARQPPLRGFRPRLRFSNLNFRRSDGPEEQRPRRRLLLLVFPGHGTIGRMRTVVVQISNGFAATGLIASKIPAASPAASCIEGAPGYADPTRAHRARRVRPLRRHDVRADHGLPRRQRTPAIRDRRCHYASRRIARSSAFGAVGHASPTEAIDDLAADIRLAEIHPVRDDCDMAHPWRSRWSAQSG